MALASQRGFTLIEIVIASGMFVVVMFAAFEALRAMTGSAAILYAAHAQTREIETVASALRDDAAAAQGMRFTPGCSEIDFFQADGGNTVNAHYWGYRLVTAGTATQLTRLDDSPAPLVPCSGAAIGTILATHLATMSVRALTVDDLDGASGTMPAEPYLAPPVSAALSSLVAVDGGAYLGGNRALEITLTGDRSARTVDLVPGVVPSAYTLRLSYTCGKRSGCNVDGTIAANGPLPEVAGRAIESCGASYGEDTGSGNSRWTVIPYDGFTYVRVFGTYTFGPESVQITDYEVIPYAVAPTIVPVSDIIARLQISTIVDAPRTSTHANDYAYCHGFTADANVLLPN